MIDLPPLRNETPRKNRKFWPDSICQSWYVTGRHFIYNYDGSKRLALFKPKFPKDYETKRMEHKLKKSLSL